MERSSKIKSNQLEDFKKWRQDSIKHRTITRMVIRDQQALLDDIYYDNNDQKNHNDDKKIKIDVVDRPVFKSHSNTNINQFDKTKDCLQKSPLIAPRGVCNKKANVKRISEFNARDSNNNENFKADFSNALSSRYPDEISFQNYNRHIEKKLNKVERRSWSALKFRTTSNNAEVNIKDILVNNKFMENANKNYHEKRHTRTFKQNETKVMYMDNSKPMNTLGDRKGKQREVPLERSNVSHDFHEGPVKNQQFSQRHSNLSKTPSSYQIDSSAFIPFTAPQSKTHRMQGRVKNSQQNNEYEDKFRERLLEWSKRVRRKRLKIVMDNGRDINLKQHSRCRNMFGPFRISGGTFTRNRTIEDNVLISMRQNHFATGVHSLKLEPPSKTIHIQVEGDVLTEREALLKITGCPTSIRFQWRLPSLGIPGQKLRLTNIQIDHFLIVSFVDVLESARKFASGKQKPLLTKMMRLQYRWLENFSKLKIYNVKVIDSSVLCWNNPFEDSWDRISETKSTVTKEALASEEFKDMSCDSRCDTEDIYGSEFETEDIKCLENGNGVDNDAADYYEEDPNLKSFDSAFDKVLIDEFEIVTYELSVERFGLPRDFKAEVEMCSQSLHLISSTSDRVDKVVRIIGRIVYHCGLRLGRHLRSYTQCYFRETLFAHLVHINASETAYSVADMFVFSLDKPKSYRIQSHDSKVSIHKGARCQWSAVAQETLKEFFSSSEVFDHLNKNGITVSYEEERLNASATSGPVCLYTNHGLYLPCIE